jgi:flagellum-specific ATP synthase
VKRFQREHALLNTLDPARAWGTIKRVVGTVAEAEGVSLPIGGMCEIHCRRTGERVNAEVVGFRDGRILVLPFSHGYGLCADDRLHYAGVTPSVRVGPGVVGRVLDGEGNPLDGRGPLAARETFPLYGIRVNPLERKRIGEVLGTGIRCLDAVLAAGRGARLGIFSGTGVGKSILLGMIARNTEADLSVIALVGERGREVREFIERDLGEEGLARSVVVVATADVSPVIRLRAVHAATAIAEYFRGQGKHVLLLVDSITRVAMAQREIGLAAGEVPTSRGYTPSVFALLPRLLERAGTAAEGSITAFHSVLVEADDIHDPIGDAVRGILDGHVWLSRDLATRNHWPAIDVLGSISRVMPDVVSPDDMKAAGELRSLLAALRDVEDLVRLGAYVSGSDPRADRALALREKIEAFLRQDRNERTPSAEARARLRALMSEKERAHARS